MTKPLSILLDKSGICVSMACMLHCLIVPFLFVLGLDSMLFIFDQEWIEHTIIFSSFTIGLLSFIPGFLQHKQHFIPVLFVAGFLLIVNGESVGSLWLAAVLSVSGAAIIAYAHVQNLKWKRRALAR